MRIVKTLAIIFLLVILTVSVIAIVTAQTDNPWSLPYKPDTGSAERKRAIAFGEDFTRPVGWTGIKYATGTRQTLGGFKGSTGVDVNLPYNEYIKYARNPGHISNFDPRMRGYTIVNEFVELEPLEYPYYIQQDKPLLVEKPSGAARVVSQRRNQFQTQRSNMPYSSVSLRVKNLPELGEYEVYEAWLVDEDTGYALSMGRVLPPMVGKVTTLNFDISNTIQFYDYIMVTKEKFPTFNRAPDGDVMLIGSIPQVREGQMPISAESYYEKEYWPGK